jgi:N-acetylneuraminic acid mutarotase
MRRALALGTAALFCFCSAIGCPLEPLSFPDDPAGSTASGTGGAPACSKDADCDDGAPCTLDQCEAGECAAKAAPEGSPCGDGDLCNGDETCNGQGACLPSDIAVIDDGDACTVDACDPATGDVTHEPAADCLDWRAIPDQGAPLARQRHTAVWTGSKMIVWGGNVMGSPSVTATGGVYDPAAKTWEPTSMDGAPPPRHSHSAVWTGSKMIVWGGYGASAYETGGGQYDPATDTWAPMTTTGAPAGRTEHSAVWTGAELIVYGGLTTSALQSGGRYDPAMNKWTNLPPPPALSPRYGHTAVWTGSNMIIWGGGNLFDWLFDGALYDPAADAWTAMTTAGAPEGREAHTAVWTGSAMVVWGGWNGGPFLKSGGVFDPGAGAGGAWTATSEAGAPSPRKEHSATWTGKAMLIWGGCGTDGCSETYADGALWTPGAGGGTWATVAANPALSARRGHTAVWTGSEVVVWGGRVDGKPTSSGAQAVIP